jgi:hypothetical protein
MNSQSHESNRTIAPQASPQVSRPFRGSTLAVAFAAALGCNSVLGIDEATLCGDGSCDGGVPPIIQGATHSNLPGAGGAASNGTNPGAGATSDASTPRDTPSVSGELGVPADDVELVPSSDPPPTSGSGSGNSGEDDNSGNGNADPGNGNNGNPDNGNNGKGNNGNGNGNAGDNPGSGGSSGGSGAGGNDPPPAEPPASPPSPCAGRANGEAFCDGATRIACGAGGTVVSSLACPSVALCTQASGAVCAACTTGEARCDGAALSVCNATHTGFTVQACGSAAQCNATQGRCDPACAANQVRCEGAVLQICNATLTGFDPVVDCGSPGACNAEAGGCNICTPGTSRCAGLSTVATCDASGQSEVLADCGLLETCSAGECRIAGLPL